MVVRLYTFLYVPDIIELVDIALPEEFLNLRVPVSQNAVQSHTTSVQKVETSLQTFLLHVVTSSHFITLSKKHVATKEASSSMLLQRFLLTYLDELYVNNGVRLQVHHCVTAILGRVPFKNKCYIIPYYILCLVW